jgi:hypothetical protein
VLPALIIENVDKLEPRALNARMDTIEPRACCPRIEKEDPNVSRENTEQLDPSLVWHLTLIDEANATKSNEDS